MIHGFGVCVFWLRSRIFFVLERNGIFYFGDCILFVKIDKRSDRIE